MKFVKQKIALRDFLEWPQSDILWFGSDFLDFPIFAVCSCTAVYAHITTKHNWNLTSKMLNLNVRVCSLEVDKAQVYILIFLDAILIRSIKARRRIGKKVVWLSVRLCVTVGK